jgi:hypothetical protein
VLVPAAAASRLLLLGNQLSGGLSGGVFELKGGLALRARLGGWLLCG